MPAHAKPKTAGFTIIETLIVIAVAGLILLMVFEAIPTLQRNSRNNARKQDVQAILGAVSHWELNNSGTLPPSPTTTTNFLQYTRLTSYDALNDVTVVALSAGGSASNQTNVDKLTVYNHQKCTSAGTASSQGAGYYDVVAMYALETASGTPLARCQQL